MIASQINAPAQLTSRGVAQDLIGLRILVPPNLGLFLTPPGNRLGTYAVCRLLELALEAAGVRVMEGTSSLSLNEAYYEFTVSKRARALETVQSELASLAILEFCELAWFDPREEVWRVWYSKSGSFQVPTADELEAERDFLGWVISATRQ